MFSKDRFALEKGRQKLLYIAVFHNHKIVIKQVGTIINCISLFTPAYVFETM